MEIQINENRIFEILGKAMFRNIIQEEMIINLNNKIAEMEKKDADNEGK